MSSPLNILENNPLWYKDAVIYQLHVKAFADSNGDGVGDFIGLTSKLDYLKNLGITALWILPFYPSPLKDDGYDISDYYSVHPQYGTLKDFKEFLRQAHARGLRVITELVINHTSDQHPWFIRAKKAKPKSSHRNYYVWSDSPDKYHDARIIFKDFENSNWAWCEEAKSYYWHRFYSHQPDLNFDNPAVQKEILNITDFWFSLGIDGLRLDAVPYLFEREGTNCENLPETHAFLKKLRKHIDSKFKNRMLLSEANQWPEDAAEYFGRGDESHMAFHFPIMPRMYMAVQMEDRFPIIDILEQTPSIPDNCQWTIFLRNHDELTLEMVTDEERDYMYHAYARDKRSRINLGIRRRLVPLLGNNRRKIELMNILLLSLPGTPIIYYGDEIGMGDNRFLGDRDGVRTPMQWSPDRNAGFSSANPQQLYCPVIIDSEYHYETINVETQESNLSSILWWMKRVISMRKRFMAFSRGSVRFLSPENAKVLSFIRQHEQEKILVVINLSRFAQSVELDLKEFSGHIPEEVFSQNDFPVIKDEPYHITLGPHTHFWFLLKPSIVESSQAVEKTAQINLLSNWEEIFSPFQIRKLETMILPNYLRKSRWFGGKSRHIRSVKVDDCIFLANQGKKIVFLLLQVNYGIGNTETYLLPVSFISSREAREMIKDHPQSLICQMNMSNDKGYLYDVLFDDRMHWVILDIIAKKRRVKSTRGELLGIPGRKLRTLWPKQKEKISSFILKAEQSNTSLVFEDVFFLKVFRKVDEGINPDIEIIRFLSERMKYPHVPAFAGQIVYQRPKTDPWTLCLLQGFVSSESNAWTYTLDHIKSFYDLALPLIRKQESKQPAESIAQEIEQDINFLLPCLDEVYTENIRLLGQRTGEMHCCLAAEAEDVDFKPEPFSLLYQRSVYQSMGSQARMAFRILKQQLPKLSKEIQGEAAPVLEKEKEILSVFKKILNVKFSAKKIRIHGDYHLGQALFTGKDFMIIDFEGEPARPLSERRLKRSALRDVAGMLRSFHYAAYATLFLNKSIRIEDINALEIAADFWYSQVSKIFLESYFETIGKAEFLPKQKKELETLLDIYLIDKAIYELGYELDNRPEWMVVPLRGIRNALKAYL